jgi:hypothetical protein
MPEAESGGGFQRRVAAVERNIADIKPEDIRVKLVGTVLDSQGERVVLDDGTGKIDVVFQEPVSVSSKIVRVFGRAVPVGDGFELQGEIVQPLDGFDMELWKKVRKIEEKE